MNSAQYLEACKRALHLPSDYKLAQRFQVDRTEISEIKRGKKPLSIYLRTKVAIVLNLDPAVVIAEIEAETDKNPVRAEFWRSFLCAARKGVLMAILAATFTASLAGGLKEPGGAFRGLAEAFLRRRQFA